MNSSLRTNKASRNAFGLSTVLPEQLMVQLISAPISFPRHFPVASKCSSAKPSGSIREWQDAHTAFLRCSSIRSRSAVGLLFPSFNLSGGTLGGGGGGGEPSRFSKIHLPRSTTEVRSA